MSDLRKQSAAFMSEGVKRLTTGLLIIAMVAPSTGMAYVRCDGTGSESTGVGDGYCEGGAWLAPETEDDIIVVPTDPRVDVPPTMSYGIFRTPYVDSRDGSAYEVEANLDTGATLVRDAAGNLVLQGQFGAEELALAREAALNLRNGDPKASAIVELIVVSLVTGLIVAVAQVAIEQSIEGERRRRECINNFFADANGLSAAAASCARSGGNFVILREPSMSSCGGSSGTCQ